MVLLAPPFFFFFLEVVLETRTSKQKLNNQGEFSLEIFLSFYLIIFKSFSLVFQIFVQCDIIYFCFGFAGKGKKTRNCLKLVIFFLFFINRINPLNYLHFYFYFKKILCNFVILFKFNFDISFILFVG